MAGSVVHVEATVDGAGRSARLEPCDGVLVAVSDTPIDDGDVVVLLDSIRR
jgi:hypothetical protein